MLCTQNGTEYLQIIEAFVPQLVENIEAQINLAELSDRSHLTYPLAALLSYDVVVKHLMASCAARDGSITRKGLQIACLRALKEQIRLQ